MKRTTLKIPDALDARLRHKAERRNLTISEIGREALEAYFGEPAGRRRLRAAAAGRSGRSDVSVRIEQILNAEDWRYQRSSSTQPRFMRTSMSMTLTTAPLSSSSRRTPDRSLSRR